MRFVILTILLALTVTDVGCATNPWSRPHDTHAAELGGTQSPTGDDAESKAAKTRPWNTSIWGSDARAREVERSLGYDGSN